MNDAPVLFTHSYFLRYDPKQWATGQPYAPIATLHAAAVIRELGFRVSFFDTMFAQSPEAILAVFQKDRPKIFVVYDDGFNYLTKMCLTNMREAAFRMIALAKQQGCTVIVSSSDATDHYELYLSKGSDFIILGEGEQTLAELITSIDSGSNDWLSIPGIAYKQQYAVIKTGKRAVLRDLDLLPLPAWDLVDITDYRKMWLKHRGFFSLNIATTRGCPFKCNWCAKPIYGNRYNSRSPRNVVDELKMLKENFDFDHIWFCDDIFGLKPGWVHEFADLLETEGLRFRFKIQARADLLLQENYVRDLARAGCENAWMGAESGSQKILDAMDKGTTVEQIYKATRLLKKYKIRPGFFIQFGYPGETKEDIMKTIRMIRDLLPSEIGISVSYPLPGTPFYDKVKSQLTEKSNWTDSDDLALMFRNTYPPAFYKQLHSYVHKVYRRQLGMQQMRKILVRPGSLSTASLKKAFSFFYYAPAAWFDKRRLSLLENAAI